MATSISNELEALGATAIFLHRGDHASGLLECSIPPGVDDDQLAVLLRRVDVERLEVIPCVHIQLTERAITIPLGRRQQGIACQVIERLWADEVVDVVIPEAEIDRLTLELGLPETALRLDIRRAWRRSRLAHTEDLP
mgnify:CR=1 FL=1